jgi:tRNA threonylcarbamoyl adenosine modification protein YeaZ
MLTLAFECSNSQLAVAIIQEGKLLSQEVIEDGFSHSELLVVKINDILQKNNLHFDDLNLVVVSNGPSSFTALRVALTVAKIINISLEKPVITVNKCESIAFFFKSNLKIFKVIENETQLTTIVGAGGEEIFIAKYYLKDGKLKTLTDPRLSNVDEIINEIQKTPNLLLFDQENLYQKFINNFPEKIFLVNNDSLHLALIGQEKYQQFGGAKEILPIYLIEPKITKRKN